MLCLINVIINRNTHVIIFQITPLCWLSTVFIPSTTLAYYFYMLFLALLCNFNCPVFVNLSFLHTFTVLQIEVVFQNMFCSVYDWILHPLIYWISFNKKFNKLKTNMGIVSYIWMASFIPIRLTIGNIFLTIGDMN